MITIQRIHQVNTRLVCIYCMCFVIRKLYSNMNYGVYGTKITDCFIRYVHSYISSLCFVIPLTGASVVSLFGGLEKIPCTIWLSYKIPLSIFISPILAWESKSQLDNLSFSVSQFLHVTS